MPPNLPTSCCQRSRQTSLVSFDSTASCKCATFTWSPSATSTNKCQACHTQSEHQTYDCHLRPKPGRHPYPNAPQSSWNASWTPQTRMENDWSQINICPFMLCLFIACQHSWSDKNVGQNLTIPCWISKHWDTNTLIHASSWWLCNISCNFWFNTSCKHMQTVLGFRLPAVFSLDWTNSLARKLPPTLLCSILPAIAAALEATTASPASAGSAIARKVDWHQEPRAGSESILKSFVGVCNTCPHHPPASGLCKLKSHSLTSSPPLRDAWVRLFSLRPLMQLFA